MENADFWSELRHFKKTENWGDADKMHPGFVQELDRFREFLGSPIVVSCGTQGVHDGSTHSAGLAADLLFPKIPLEKLFDVCLDAMRFKFTGIGIYNDWKLGEKVLGGLHLDLRETSMRSLWIGIRENQARRYLPLDKFNLQRAGLIP